MFETHVRVEDVLLRGLKRFDEMKRIRNLFYDPGIVLAKTGKKPPLEVTQHRAASRIFEAIDGERTVADIVLEVHGSEHLVTKFLFELHRGGFVVVKGIRQQAAPEESPAAVAVASESAQSTRTAASAPLPPSRAPQHPAADPVPDLAHTAPEAGLEVARRLMNQGDCDNALSILDGLYRNRPGDDSLRRLVAEAEAAFVEKAYRHYLPASKIPYLKHDPASLASEHLSPVEYFLISRIDGNWDVRSIIHVAPIREVDVLRTLKRLRERGLIDLREP